MENPKEKTHLEDQNLDGIWAKMYVKWMGCDYLLSN